MADNWKNDPNQSGGKSGGDMPDTQHKQDQGQQRPGQPQQPSHSQQKPMDKESDRDRQSNPQKKAS
jgi:hypothetical protein